MNEILPIIYGLIVGLSLGLTGGGGAIFAVPLLVYGLGLDLRTAVAVSLVTVGSTALFGTLLKIKSKSIEYRTILLLALAGMLGAPVGTRIGAQLPDVLTLSLFSIIMLIVGVNMWFKRSGPKDQQKSTCKRSGSNEMVWNSRCALLLLGVGIFVGILTGIFGVGGGFIIVPALMFTTGMPVYKAVSSSLLAITLLSLSAVISLGSTTTIPGTLSILFVVGALLGMLAGSRLAVKIPEQSLRRIFSIGMWITAVAILLKNLYPMS